MAYATEEQAAVILKFLHELGYDPPKESILYMDGQEATDLVEEIKKLNEHDALLLVRRGKDGRIHTVQTVQKVRSDGTGGGRECDAPRAGAEQEEEQVQRSQDGHVRAHL